MEFTERPLANPALKNHFLLLLYPWKSRRGTTAEVIIRLSVKGSITIGIVAILREGDRAKFENMEVKLATAAVFGRADGEIDLTGGLEDASGC